VFNLKYRLPSGNRLHTSARANSGRAAARIGLGVVRLRFCRRRLTISTYARWAPRHNSLLVIFDENAGGTAKSIPTIIVGANVRPGVYSERLNHCFVRGHLWTARAWPRQGRIPTVEDLDALADSTMPSPRQVNDLFQGSEGFAVVGTCVQTRAHRRPCQQLDQQWCGAKLPSISAMPGCSTTIVDQPSSVGRIQPLDAVR
jgi:hypothetical protein